MKQGVLQEIYKDADLKLVPCKLENSFVLTSLHVSPFTETQSYRMALVGTLKYEPEAKSNNQNIKGWKQNTQSP